MSRSWRTQWSVSWQKQFSMLLPRFHALTCGQYWKLLTRRNVFMWLMLSVGCLCFRMWFGWRDTVSPLSAPNSGFYFMADCGRELVIILCVCARVSLLALLICWYFIYYTDIASTKTTNVQACRLSDWLLHWENKYHLPVLSCSRQSWAEVWRCWRKLVIWCCSQYLKLDSLCALILQFRKRVAIKQHLSEWILAAEWVRLEHSNVIDRRGPFFVETYPDTESNDAALCRCVRFSDPECTC